MFSPMRIPIRKGVRFNFLFFKRLLKFFDRLAIMLPLFQVRRVEEISTKFFLGSTFWMCS